MTEKKKRTRKGTSNRKRIQNVVIPSSCPACGSTNRERYQPNPIVKEISGQINGVEYNRVTWKRTKCKDCPQHRTDRIYENIKK